MKKIFILTFCTLIIFGASAQQKKFNLGVHGGWNTTRIKTNFAIVNTEGGYMYGIFGRYNLNNKTYLEAAIDRNYRSTSVQTVGTSKDDKLRYHSLDIPVLFGVVPFKIPALKVRAFVGPNISLLTKDMFVQNGIDDPKEKHKTDNFMIYGRFGAGIDFWKATLDLSYEIGVKDFGNGIKRPNTFNFTIGFLIL